MEKIKDTVSNIMQSLAVKKAPLKKNPEAILKKVLTKRELSHIRFNYFRNGNLSLKVDSSPWLYHFSLKKDALLAQMNQKSKLVKEIKFSIAEM